MIEKKSFKFGVKAEEAPGKFTGRASVYGVVDFHNDVVMPGAFAEYLASNGPTIKVLAQHNPMDPVGTATLTDSDTALLVEGSLVLDLPSGKNMYTAVVNDLIDGLSIGYTVPSDGYVYRDGIRQLTKIDLVEISLVTFPANDFARVTDVKSAGDARLEDALRSASWAMSEMKAGRVINLAKVKAAYQAWGEVITAAEPSLDDDAVAAAKMLLEDMRAFRASLQ